MFLSTLGRVPEIRAALSEGAGYTEADHTQGWRLLLTAMGYSRLGITFATSNPFPQQTALVELDQWDGLAFDRTRASLRLAFPEQHDYVFQGLNAATGADAIGTVQTFVERVVALRDGTDPNRAETREQDQAAAERLAERKIFNPEIQAHLEGLLEQAKQSAPLPKGLSNDDEVQNASDELHVWLSDWTGQVAEIALASCVAFAVRAVGTANRAPRLPLLPDGRRHADAPGSGRRPPQLIAHAPRSLTNLSTPKTSALLPRPVSRGWFAPSRTWTSSKSNGLTPSRHATLTPYCSGLERRW
jgi:hypothetical protein